MPYNFYESQCNSANSRDHVSDERHEHSRTGERSCKDVSKSTLVCNGLKSQLHCYAKSDITCNLYHGTLKP